MSSQLFIHSRYVTNHFNSFFLLVIWNAMPWMITNIYGNEKMNELRFPKRTIYIMTVQLIWNREVRNIRETWSLLNITKSEDNWKEYYNICVTSIYRHRKEPVNFIEKLLVFKVELYHSSKLHKSWIHL